MERSYVQPFVESTTQMLEMMVGLSCGVQDAGGIVGDELISGTVLLTGEKSGGIRLLFPVTTAESIVAEMLGMTSEEVDEETLKDGVGEMANIVAGNVKAALSEAEFDFKLTLPEVQMASAEGVAENTLQSRLRTELGDFDLIFWLSV